MGRLPDRVTLDYGTPGQVIFFSGNSYGTLTFAAGADEDGGVLGL